MHMLCEADLGKLLFIHLCLLIQLDGRPLPRTGKMTLLGLLRHMFNPDMVPFLKDFQELV